MPNRWKPNVTVAAIIERDNRFLLVEEETADGLRLQLPSGHLDPAESPQQACVREVLEETAFDFEPSAVVGIYLNRFVRTRAAADITYLRLVFCGQIGQHHAGRTLDDGIVGTHWLSLAELKANSARLRSPIVLQSIDDYLAGRRYPLDLIHTDASVGLSPFLAQAQMA